MKLEGACHCRRVQFALVSHTPYPFMVCYCSICRKTQGGGGFAINIMGEAESFFSQGETKIYQAFVPDASGGEKQSPAERHFCPSCGSMLWVSDPRWPEWIYPFASAIDTPLPAPPERLHIMQDSKASWVSPPSGASEKIYDHYPEEGIEDWHRRMNLLETE